MIVYNHSTPEKLITKYYSVEQLRIYPVCELAKDVPNDLLTTTDFTIVESKDTMNLDLSLAVLYNNITDLESALQFARILVINGPRIDTKTIIFYVDRINNGPFGGQVGDYIARHFRYASSGRKINNIVGDAITSSDIYDYDQNFTNQLIDAAKDCLYAPCNYFNYSSGMGLLDNPEYIPSIHSTPPGDLTQDIAPPGVPVAKSIYNKILPTIQNNLLMMKQSLMTMGKNITSLFYTDGELRDQDRAFKAGNSAYNTTGASQVTVDGKSRPDYTTYFAFQKAKLAVMSITANALGDCGRINAFFRQYNPYDSEQNLDNERGYYNPYARSYPGRTRESLGAEQPIVQNHNVAGETGTVITENGDTQVVDFEGDGYIVSPTINITTRVYGYLKEFGSPKDDPYVGSPNGETSWDIIGGSLRNPLTWLGSTTYAKYIQTIENTERKQTISQNGITVPTIIGEAEDTLFIRSANPVGGAFRTSNCGITSDLVSYLNSFNIGLGDTFKVLLDNGSGQPPLTLKWVDIIEGDSNKLYIFRPQYDPGLDNILVFGFSKQGISTTAEVITNFDERFASPNPIIADEDQVVPPLPEDTQIQGILDQRELQPRGADVPSLEGPLEGGSSLTPANGNPLLPAPPPGS